VIDVKTDKAIVDYEKTKIFMSPLTDFEIDQYHKRVPPLDKAGGFDIEGLSRRCNIIYQNNFTALCDQWSFYLVLFAMFFWFFSNNKTI